MGLHPRRCISLSRLLMVLVDKRLPCFLSSSCFIRLDVMNGPNLATFFTTRSSDNVCFSTWRLPFHISHNCKILWCSKELYLSFREYYCILVISQSDFPWFTILRINVGLSRVQSVSLPISNYVFLLLDHRYYTTWPYVNIFNRITRQTIHYYNQNDHKFQMFYFYDQAKTVLKLFATKNFTWRTHCTKVDYL